MESVLHYQSQSAGAKEEYTMEDLKVSVLIVDDSESNLKVMEHILADEHLRLVKARSGEDALKALLSPEEFALIFMDVRMPGMDGFEAAALIRQRQKSAAIPIIFLTAYGESENIAFKGYSLGAVDFLVKPVAPEVLKSKLAVFVELHRKNQILRQQEQELRASHDELEQRVQERTRQLHVLNEELRIENLERQRTEVALTASLSEKEVLLKEIHHRVKNNLQIISSLLSLQSDYITDARSKELFQESQARIRSIALVHELLYSKGDLAHMNFGEYVQSLVGNLFRTYSNGQSIRYEIQADAVDLSLDSAIHCGLIITELVTNSLKYGFYGRDHGLVSIGLRDLRDGVLLSVEDDGVGLPEDFDYKNSNSYGLQLVSTLAEQIGAEVTVERDGGTRFGFKFHQDNLVRG